jgi:hypothetical protein
MFRAQHETAVVTRAANRVFRELGGWESESVYQNALAVELGMCAKEVVANILYRGTFVGFHRYDIVYGDTIIEVKTSKVGHRSLPSFAGQIAKYNRHKRPEQQVVLVVFWYNGVIIR